jgi:polar amino acid transport system permease protein
MSLGPSFPNASWNTRIPGKGASVRTYHFNFRVLMPYLNNLLSGASVTLYLSLLIILVGFALGILGAVARRSRSPWLRKISATYVDVMRNTPALVQLYLVYFGAGEAGIRMSAFTAALIALSLNCGGYATEIFRAGLDAIPKGQTEAALSLSLRPLQVFRLVILPQAVRIVYPPLGNQVVAVILNSSVAAVVAAKELTASALDVGGLTFRYFETFTIAIVGYILVVQIVNLLWSGMGRAFFSRVPGR